MRQALGALFTSLISFPNQRALSPFEHQTPLSFTQREREGVVT